MKSIVDNKLYDTEKADKIFDYIKNVAESIWILGKEYKQNCWRDVDMYKTKKGNYFIHIKQPNKENNSVYYGYKKEYIEAITEEEAKRIVRKLDVEKSIELFGKVEEA